jgi:2-hydroxychromene-2-carboxylate isomerase
MKEPIEFYFDFSSPYGYLACLQTRAIERETAREVVYKPYLMGAVFKTTGRQPLASHALVWDYAHRDIQRCARRIDAPFTLPDPFPVATAAACRAFYWVEQHQGRDSARQLAQRIYTSYFVDGRDISSATVVAEVTAGEHADIGTVSAALEDGGLRQRLREITDQAAQRGIFGSPFFIVDDEPFWGHDRIEDVIEWSNSGGW